MNETHFPVFLKAKVILVIFFNIQCFDFSWDSFTGIIFKFSAGVVNGNNAMFGAEDLFVTYLCSAGTVAARAGEFLRKQHLDTSFADFS